ncbi:tryptophanase [Actinocatenispora thailandica]|uniref:Tryptophanase n=1 Tax=Actinocatenispora thailandica TaxID=227318 RepID=A0A7R7DWS4_9ACTN|nr:tryptophanase [Actinocatenispora thailandica]BCJ39313.1 tryptophanase [Actinocatenispora thailandica]
MTSFDPVMADLDPYCNAVVRRLSLTTRQQREEGFRAAGYNPFRLPARLVTIDALSDSGTGALSIEQRAASARADERYATSESWERFAGALRSLSGFEHIIPCTQGRTAESVVFSTMLSAGQFSVSNTHFDTTSANVQLAGATPVNLPCPEAADLDSDHPFKGNIDVAALEALLAGPDGHRVGLVLMTITNNGGGGQPVSIANLRATREICQRYRVPMFLDAARYAENAWLVIRREAEFADATPREVAGVEFDLADGFVISLKKDPMSPGGGAIGIRDENLAAAFRGRVIATAGFATYGGMTGETLEEAAQGIEESVDPAYLRSRERTGQLLADVARDAGVDSIRPAGLHAIYLNAGRLMQHIPPAQFPGHSLAVALYLQGGIRSSELGSLYLGELDDEFRLVTPAPFELVRLALPRRVYTENHIRYVGSVLAEVAKDPQRWPGYRIVRAPAMLRPFEAWYDQVPAQ